MNGTRRKAKSNLRKHGVSFSEAITVFGDARKLIVYDSVHSEAEDRDIVIGYSAKLRLLLVVVTERYEAIRIISAKKASDGEAARYVVGR